MLTIIKSHFLFCWCYRQRHDPLILAIKKSIHTMTQFLSDSSFASHFLSRLDKKNLTQLLLLLKSMYRMHLLSSLISLGLTSLLPCLDGITRLAEVQVQLLKEPRRLFLHSECRFKPSCLPLPSAIHLLMLNLKTPQRHEAFQRLSRLVTRTLHSAVSPTRLLIKGRKISWHRHHAPAETTQAKQADRHYMLCSSS